MARRVFVAGGFIFNIFSNRRVFFSLELRSPGGWKFLVRGFVRFAKCALFRSNSPGANLLRNDFFDHSFCRGARLAKSSRSGKFVARRNIFRIDFIFNFFYERTFGIFSRGRGVDYFQLGARSANFQFFFGSRRTAFFVVSNAQKIWQFKFRKWKPSLKIWLRF